MLHVILTPTLFLKVNALADVFVSMTNKMQRDIILFINVNALHVSSGFSAIIRGSNLYMQHQVFAVTSSMGESQFIHARVNSKHV